MYNYRVAAYLKTSASNLHLRDLQMESLDFSVLPKSIPKENSFLGVEDLFDIFISGSEREYLGECKHHEIPRVLTLNSIEVKDGLLEFIAAEKYRINSIKRDGISYLFITNCPTAKLNKEVDCLRIAKDLDVSDYSKTLEKRAPKKWESFDASIKIKVEWVRNVLLRMIIVEIDDGRLQQAAKDSLYDQEFRKIIDQVSQTSPRLIPLEYRVKNTIRFDTNDGEEDTIDIQKGGYLIEISRLIVSQILTYNWTPSHLFAKAEYRDLYFVKDCRISHHSNISTEKSMELIIETINDLIKEQPSKRQFFIAINPGTYDVYFANVDWFYKLAVTSMNAKGFFDVAKIARLLPVKVSKFVLAHLIEEVMRLKANRIVRQDVMDFVELDNQDYSY